MFLRRLYFVVPLCRRDILLNHTIRTFYEDLISLQVYNFVKKNFGHICFPVIDVSSLYSHLLTSYCSKLYWKMAINLIIT